MCARHIWGRGAATNFEPGDRVYLVFLAYLLEIHYSLALKIRNGGSSAGNSCRSSLRCSIVVKRVQSSVNKMKTKR